MNSKRLAKEGLIIVNKKSYGGKTLYDSIEPTNISYQETLIILNNLKKWRKLNLGERLNVIKVYSNTIADELGIECPDIHFVQYKGIFNKLFVTGNAISIKDGVALNIRYMKNPADARGIVAHEIKHIHQFYAIDDYKFRHGHKNLNSHCSDLPCQKTDKPKGKQIQRPANKFLKSLKNSGTQVNKQRSRFIGQVSYSNAKKNGAEKNSHYAAQGKSLKDIRWDHVSKKTCHARALNCSTGTFYRTKTYLQDARPVLSGSKEASQKRTSFFTEP